MRLILFALLALTGTAYGQQPIPADLGDPPAIVNKYILEDVTSQRFADEDTAGPLFKRGDFVQVLSEDQTKVRIVSGAAKFGWVPASTLGEEPPPPDLAPDPAIPAPN